MTTCDNQHTGHRLDGAVLPQMRAALDDTLWCALHGQQVTTIRVLVHGDLVLVGGVERNIRHEGVLGALGNDEATLRWEE